MKRLLPLIATGISTVLVLFGILNGFGGLKFSLPNVEFMTLTLSPPTNSSLLAQAVLGDINIHFPKSLLYNEYKVYLWSFCTKAHLSINCSSRTSQFSFDPIEAWQIANETLPDALTTALDIHSKVSRYVGILYIVALAFGITTVAVGVCSLGGPKFTRTPILPLLVSCISCVLWLVVSAFTTVTFGTLVATFKAVSQNTGVDSSLGQNAFVFVWVAFAFSYMATCTWFIAALFSFCFH